MSATISWTEDLPETSDYYWDTEIKDISKKLREYPPDNLDLSDAWVVAIVNSKLSREDRGASWPAVFTNRGALRAHYTHKGQSAKLYDTESKSIKYALLFGEHHMIGAEGVAEGLPTRRLSALSDVDPVTCGLVAQIQDMNYDEEQAEKDAAAARNSTARPKATKKTIAPRNTGFTPINRRAASDVKKSTAADEEDDPEDEPARRPATRQSKRLLRKDDNRSESPQPTESTEGSDKDATKQPLRKKQKMTIRKPSTPSNEAPDATSSPKAPTTSTSQKQQGKLLPLLMQKDSPDVRLMHTARASQGTLTKLVTAIAGYHLTMEEKAYLHSLAENNDKMTEQLKHNHPNFFERIFVDPDIDFDSWVKSVTDSTNTSSNPPAAADKATSSRIQTISALSLCLSTRSIRIICLCKEHDTSYSLSPIYGLRYRNFGSVESVTFGAERQPSLGLPKYQRSSQAKMFYDYYFKSSSTCYAPPFHT